ncbi:nucleotidyltransferase family protein [Methylobacterium sp. Leaf106]|uniref:nucleotidyltransferase family protein n=1 Tax=Methylobacterium sp. Leaf106 TaxID=1736255 RepID=UPI0007022618|nr:nucleotidyltransferase family protein [Methylobacterium sp. Leaf106]KQP41769.1 4-diphosphocytidyl-2C-methyl-D-erythritol kinase [Methylobacterium sp. Leaf106]
MPDAVGIVLLAAGRGTRFGSAAKMLALLDGRPLVRHAAEIAIAANLGPVAVILGSHGAAVRQALAGLDLRIVDNPAHAEGLSTSLRCGLDALPETARIIVMLGDMPRIRPSHLASLVEAFLAADPAPAAIVPVHRGSRGNPVLLNRALLASDLASLTGDQGAGRILAARTDVVELEMDAAVALDIDTQAALIAAARA